MSENLVGLVERLYEASIHPQQWRTFLEALAAALDARATGFLHQDLSHRRDSIVACVGLAATELHEYERDYAATNPFMVDANHGFRPGTVVADDAACPRAVLRRNVCYNDFFLPRDMVHVLGAIVARDGSSLTNLSVQRGARAGPFTREECGLVERLVPHLRRVVEIHRHLSGDYTGGLLEDVADHLRLGVVTVEADGTALFVSAGARRVFRAKDGLTLASGRVRAMSRVDQWRLEQAVRSVADGPDGQIQPTPIVSVGRPSGQRPYLVLVAATSGPTAPWIVARRVAAVVFISDPDERGVHGHEWLAQAYGLTPAEARLATILAEGVSLDEAADRMGISKETARSHLKRTFDKTQTCRQAELVALLIRALDGLPSQVPLNDPPER